jgi:hypothetical protein
VTKGKVEEQVEMEEGVEVVDDYEEELLATEERRLEDERRL